MAALEVIAAKTHPSEYLLHKYWARKPHNVIAELLSSLVPINGVVVDPFCGSGVVIREATLQGIPAFGFDVNPIATLISTVTSMPPLVHDFELIVGKIIDEFENDYSHAYTHPDTKSTIRYLVHETVVKCTGCASEVPFSDSSRLGKLYKCPSCTKRLSFNLENLIRTTITSIVFDDKRIQIDDPDALLLAEQRSLVEYYHGKVDYNIQFCENRRILAFDGLTTSMLFTRRNFSILSAICDRFHEIADENIRLAALVMFTASVAQCSRLIPYRNNMGTGGPAWSVPGFWVPPTHLETNPIIHLRARMKKFMRGLGNLNARPASAPATIKMCSAIEGMRELQCRGTKADLIFFDPPYGDSVPYIEFSALWNSFLRIIADVNRDISVSDRMPKQVAWEKYATDLKEVITEIALTLKDSGSLAITFNNHDLRAWDALLGALQNSDFECKFVTYQIPAVVSSKAQLAVEGSYVSDIYAVYQIHSSGITPSRSLTPVVEALRRCALSRKGSIPRSLALRVLTIAWMENNVAVELLQERDALLSSLFKEEDGLLRWAGSVDENHPCLEETAIIVAERLLKKGPCDWSTLYQAVAQETVKLGVPDPGELKSLLADHIVISKDRCLAIQEKHNDLQLDLF
jgi:hypothetical protein